MDIPSHHQAKQIEQLRAENAALKAQLAAAQKDSQLLDFIEYKTATSKTGVSFDEDTFIEDGQVVENGFRMMWYHNLSERKPTLRAAIDAAILKEQGE